MRTSHFFNPYWGVLAALPGAFPPPVSKTQRTDGGCWNLGLGNGKTSRIWWNSWPSVKLIKLTSICLCQESFFRFLNQLLVEKRYLCFWWKRKHLRDVKKRKDEVRNVQRDERTYGCNYFLKGSLEILTLKWPVNAKIETTHPTYLQFTIVTHPKT